MLLYISWQKGLSGCNGCIFTYNPDGIPRNSGEDNNRAEGGIGHYSALGLGRLSHRISYIRKTKRVNGEGGIAKWQRTE